MSGAHRQRNENVVAISISRDEINLRISKMSLIMRLIKQYPMVAFFALTYAISWMVWVPLAVAQVDHPLYKLGTFGPTLAALILTALISGRSGIKQLLRRLLIWRVPIFWYLFSFLSTAVGVLAAIGIHV